MIENYKTLNYRRDVEIDDIIKLLYQGLKIKEICAYFNCSNALLYKRFKEYGMNLEDFRKLLENSAIYLEKSL